MAIIAKGSEGSDFEPVSQGTHIARCITVVDCGMQKTEWQGQEKWQHKVWKAFEVPAERAQWTDKEGKEHEGPKIIGKLYTNSLHEKSTLGQHLASWRGRAFTGNEIKEGFDVGTLLDKPCQLSVTHRQSKDGSKTFANITGIMGLPAGMEAPPRESDLTLYDPTAAEAPQVFDRLPKWLQEKVTFGHRLDTNQPVMPATPPVMPNMETGDPGIDYDDIPY